MGKFITSKEAADLLELHRNSIKKMIMDGRLEAVDIGTGKRSHYRIFEKSVADFLVKKYGVTISQRRKEIAAGLEDKTVKSILVSISDWVSRNDPIDNAYFCKINPQILSEAACVKGIQIQSNSQGPFLGDIGIAPDVLDDFKGDPGRSLLDIILGCVKADGVSVIDSEFWVKVYDLEPNSPVYRITWKYKGDLPGDKEFYAEEEALISSAEVV